MLLVVIGVPILVSDFVFDACCNGAALDLPGRVYRPVMVEARVGPSSK